MTLDLKTSVSIDDIAEGIPVAAQVGDKSVVVVRTGSRICVLSGACTHAGAPMVDGIIADGEIRCPWHHARFSLETGEALGAPAFTPLSRYDVIETDGRFHVDGEPTPVSAKPVGKQPGRILIVGGGGAGYACAQMLARHGAGAWVTLVSAERDAPYDRTICSKELLTGDLQREEAFLPNLPDVSLQLATVVASIDTASRSVVTVSGERIVYDRLVLATGADPRMPQFEGADRDDVHLVRTLGDADRLSQAVSGAQRAIVIGSSFIGLEVASSLVRRNVRVAVVTLDGVPLERSVGPETGGFVRSLHEKKGVEFHMGRTVVRWDGKTATLDDDGTLAGDMIIAGIGVTPRISVAQAAGLAIATPEQGGGVKVDSFLRTSGPDIFAIGDIANYPDPRLGYGVRVEHWVAAQRMGQWLARHLLGLETTAYHDTPFFWSSHYDVSLNYVGHASDTHDRQVEGNVSDGIFTVAFREHGVQQALLTCGQDRASLEAEARLDQMV